MGIKKAIRLIVNAAGYDIIARPPIDASPPVDPPPPLDSFPPKIYDQDSLLTSHNHDFMNDSKFMTHINVASGLVEKPITSIGEFMSHYGLRPRPRPWKEILLNVVSIEVFYLMHHEVHRLEFA